MKLNREKIKNLFKKEINKDFLKISLALFSYLIIFAIFKAGYDYQSIVPITTKSTDEDKPKINNNYSLNFFGNTKEVILDGDNSLLDVLQEDRNNQIEYQRYYEGNKITSINKTTNFKIYINDKLIENNFLTDEYEILQPNSKIKITY